MHRYLWGMILLSLVVGASPAFADQAPPPYAVEYDTEASRPTRGFIEAYGNWGVNLGRTDYVPDHEPGKSKHPFANGFGAGATLGVTIAGDWLSLIGDYRYGHSSTRKGTIDGVLTKAQGKVDFHMITAGLRLEHRLGGGRLYAQMMAGVLVPFHTTRELEYAPQLAAVGLTGTGTEKADFGLGVGAQAELGYKIDLPSRLYFGAGLRLAAFQSTNAGEETELTNFVVDFTMPVPVTTTIHHGTEAPVTPTTYSIQDVRINISIGYRF